MPTAVFSIGTHTHTHTHSHKHATRHVYKGAAARPDVTPYFSVCTKIGIILGVGMFRLFKYMLAA